MAISKDIRLSNGLVIPILHEDRSVLAIDKPAGWLLAPTQWDKTGRNLQLAFQSFIRAGEYWARSRNLQYLRFIHRLDACTSGVVLFAKNPGVLNAYSRLFATRNVEKVYLAVVQGVPQQRQWSSSLRLAPHATDVGRMIVDARNGKDARTEFRVIKTAGDMALIEARPITGRTHQIRVHLAAADHPVLNDPIYGIEQKANYRGSAGMALRAIFLSFKDPFKRRQIELAAPYDEFIKQYGFESAAI